MPRDTRRRLEALAARMRPSVRRAFLSSVARIAQSTDLGALVRLLEAGDTAGVLGALRLGPELLAPLEEAVRSVFAAGGAYQTSSLPVRDPGSGTRLVVQFQGQSPRAQQYLRDTAGRLIVEIGSETRQAVRLVLEQGLAEGLNPRVIGRRLIGQYANGQYSGGIIGLTRHETEMVLRRRAALTAEGRAAAQVERMTARYSSRLLRARSERIARTEVTRALNAARLEAMEQLTEQTHIRSDQITKRWDTASDSRVRDSHSGMNGQTVGVGEPFSSPIGGLLMMPGDTSLGAGPEDTINCRCYGAIRVDYLGG